MGDLKLFMTLCLAAAIGAALGPAAWGGPSISSTSGTFAHGNSVTISGSDFGTKSYGAAPQKFEDFEDGTHGSLLTTTGYWNMDSDNVTAEKPQFSNAETRHSHSGLAGKFIEKSLQDITYTPDLNFSGRKIYMDLWLRFQWASLTEQHQNKLFKFQSAVNNNSVDASPRMNFYSWRYGPDSVSSYIPLSNCVQKYILSPGDTPAWYHWQMELLNNDVGSPNGEYRLWRDGRLLTEAYNLEPRLDGDNHFNCFWLGRYLGNYEGSLSNTLYYDEVYLDDSWARVEIGDRPDWDYCGVRELQIPSAWSSTSITATLKQNSLAAGAAWLYVVDDDGDVSDGELITITVSGGTTYTLTVNSGMGDADYPSATAVQIAADDPPSGQVFHKWTGDVSCVDDTSVPTPLLQCRCRALL